MQQTAPVGGTTPFKKTVHKGRMEEKNIKKKREKSAKARRTSHKTICFHSTDMVTDKTRGAPSTEQNLPVQLHRDR